ncbi:MAG: ABC-type nitrate/sulfonate/bicarbonate transport system [Microvirga sp.]|jgi:NitT/TauT family transport system substrate-binding protein|nr:ABC-type nitrate/sulfonate/bicarbonate transport system [Microvirga sp.]
MHIMQSRRDFLAGASLTAAAGVLGARESLAGEGPPEVTTIRLRRDAGMCIAPWYVGEELLRAEGFTDIRYVPVRAGLQHQQMIGSGDIDFTLLFAGTSVSYLDAGVPITVVAGLHAGCFELFAHEPIRTISDLKGKKVGIEALGAGKHTYLAILAAHVGLDPHKDIEWVESSADPLKLFPLELFLERKVDAILGFPPEPQELRARKVGRVILNTTTEKPWSQYFCCVVVGNREFVRDHPVATKRVVRALLKANDICAAEPEQAAQQLVDRGFTERYDYVLETLTDIPFAQWREFDAADALRFFALRLHEVGMIKSSPNAILVEGTDWRFLNELKRELKA